MGDTEHTSLTSEKQSTEFSGQRQQQPQQQSTETSGQRQQQLQQKPQQQEDADDEDLEFGALYNYPEVGHGVSDDISVVSDLTIPPLSYGLHLPLQVGSTKLSSRGTALARRRKKY